MSLAVLAIAYVVYGLGAFGLIATLRRLGVSLGIAVVLAFLALGIVAGLVSYSTWPNDISVIFNIPGALTGDKLYRWSILLLGDPSSSQAHFTIPWILRIPQVYVLSSVIAWLLLGLIVRLAYHAFRRRASPRAARRQRIS
ncbi:MAG: hypothetical protein Q8P00_06825 [Dehalococcoidia bacterium]|nr:hypothetical protein [Dehalococcoidia bacterium]